MLAFKFLATRSLLALLACSPAFGQGRSDQSPIASQPQQNSGVATPAMQYFGRGRIKTTAKQHVRQLLPPPRPLQVAGAKPFQSLQRGATLSPYLDLDLRTSEFSIPNFHAFVRPKQQQQLANKAQVARLQRLQHQMRAATAQGIVSNSPTGGIPTTGHSAQFLNMGSYFPPAR